MSNTTTKIWSSTFQYIESFLAEINQQIDQIDRETKKKLALLQAALPWGPSHQNQPLEPNQNQQQNNELITVSSISNLLLAINQQAPEEETFDNPRFRFVSHNSSILSIFSTVSHFIVMSNVVFSLLFIPTIIVSSMVGGYSYWNAAQKDKSEQERINADLLECLVKKHCEQIKVDLAQKKFTQTYQTLCADNPNLNKELPTTTDQLSKNLTAAGYPNIIRPVAPRRSSTDDLVKQPPIYRSKLSSPVGRAVTLAAALFSCAYFATLKFAFAAALIASGPIGWIITTAICVGIGVYFGYQRYQQLKHEQQCQQRLYKLQMNVAELKNRQDELSTINTLVNADKKTKSISTEPALQVANHPSPTSAFRRTPRPNRMPPKSTEQQPTAIAESVCRLVMSGG